MKNIRKFGPITIIFCLMFVVALVSLIFSLIGIDAKQTFINGKALETQLIAVNNLFSLAGIKYIFTSVITNIKSFLPLFQLIIALITIGIMDKSGIIKAIATKLKKLKFKYITALVLILSILSIYVGDYSYAFMLPFIALIYKRMGKSPILGIITVFIGLTLSYGLGFLSNNYALGLLTQVSARLEVDPTYTFALSSNVYITVLIYAVLIILGSNLIEKKLAFKFNNPENEDEITVSKEAGQYTIIVLCFLVSILVYLIIPSSYSGFLLDNTKITYIEQLFSDTSPFGVGLPYIVLMIMMVCSFVYGKISKNIYSSKDYSQGLTSSFEKTGYIFSIIFFMAQLIALINWTNLDKVLAANALDFLTKLNFSGLPLIFIAFIIIFLITLVMPSSLDKWILLSPLLIPFMMKANITPDFTQTLFTVADSVGKLFTPLFMYYVITIGLIYKYSDKKIGLFGVTKSLFPIILTIVGVLFLIIISWFLIGLPLGLNILPTL